jgi:opacity protein-like surface antigen
MRKSILRLALVLTFVAGSVAAQDQPAFRLFAGIAPGASYSEIDGLDVQSAYVLGLDTYLSPSWALEAAAWYQRDSFPSGSPTAVTITTTSFDAAARRDLMRQGRWTLHGLAGIRYSEREDVRRAVDSQGGPLTLDTTSDRTGLLLGLGADLRLSERFDLRLGAKYVPWTFSGDGRAFEDTVFSTALAIDF